MADDNLEGLDNASLRKKCLEYGLPNVPITDTSRKLLIRRLRSAITVEPADKKKNRRETIHVTKIPSPVEIANAQEEEAPKRPPSRINRRTIAATSVTSTVDDTTLPTAPVSDRRRSVRSQADYDAPIGIPVSQKRKTAVVVEEEDEDDDDDVIILEAAERGERQAKEVVIPRTRRSVSLSKTGVVTTSYSQETVTAPLTVNETESESDSDFVAQYANSYEPITRPLAQPRKPQDATYGLSQRKVVVEPDRTASYRTVTVNRTSIEPEPIYKPSLPPPRYSSLGSGYSANTASSLTSSSTRRFTTGGYGAAIDPPSKYTSVYDHEGDDDDESETPYLSDFARKLERLKTEPLGKGVESPRNIPIQRDTQRYQSSILGRRSTIQKSSVADSFKDFLLALDRKYNLKRNFAILLVVILLLFIYIVFIH